MAIKLTITGKRKLIQDLKRHANALDGGKRINAAVVGYTQTYAVFVHEDLEAAHAPGKQAKFLEGPARVYAGDIAARIRNVTKQTGSIVKGLLAGGLLLQRKSQQLVPVDTGALKASAYTRLDTAGDG